MSYQNHLVSPRKKKRKKSSCLVSFVSLCQCPYFTPPCIIWRNGSLSKMVQFCFYPLIFLAQSNFLITSSPVTRTISRLCLGFVLGTCIGPLACTATTILMKWLVQLMRHSWDKQMWCSICTRQTSILAPSQTKWRGSC